VIDATVDFDAMERTIVDEISFKCRDGASTARWRP
jgi:hypothetical protein